MAAGQLYVGISLCVGLVLVIQAGWTQASHCTGNPVMLQSPRHLHLQMDRDYEPRSLAVLNGVVYVLLDHLQAVRCYSSFNKTYQQHADIPLVDPSVPSDPPGLSEEGETLVRGLFVGEEIVSYLGTNPLLFVLQVPWIGKGWRIWRINPESRMTSVIAGERDERLDYVKMSMSGEFLVLTKSYYEYHNRTSFRFQVDIDVRELNGSVYQQINVINASKLYNPAQVILTNKFTFLFVGHFAHGAVSEVDQYGAIINSLPRGAATFYSVDSATFDDVTENLFIVDNYRHRVVRVDRQLTCADVIMQVNSDVTRLVYGVTERARQQRRLYVVTSPSDDVTSSARNVTVDNYQLN